ncbi:hypothetical protein [Quadrisphaera sp. KR29]|uniref:hypothetical protein n=1 Tax=Quadrisphaera sp. KR29 TaxID=3461391 RepID=UPI004043AF81
MSEQQPAQEPGYDDSVRVSGEERDRLEQPAESRGAAFIRWKARGRLHAIDRGQSQGVHEVLWIAVGGRATCSCGLLVDQDDDGRSETSLLRAHGHRVLPQLGGPEWVLVTGTTTNRDHPGCTVTCQRCGWRRRPSTWLDADRLRREHRAGGCVGA